MKQARKDRIRTLFVSFLLLMLGWLPSSAQSQAIKLPGQQIRISTLISNIEKQTGYLFVYKTVTLNSRDKLIFPSKTVTLGSALNKLVEGRNVSYQITSDKHIVLSLKAHASSKQTNTGQGRKVKATGRILDASGNPVVGAAVMEKGTHHGTVTDMDGHYALEVSDNSELEVSYLGFRPKTVTPGQNMDISLEEDSKEINEVVVIGYGTANRQAITGSVAKANIDSYRETPNTNVLDVLKGTMPGLNVSGTNQAGQVASFYIRGQNSTSGNTPLVVIDGAVYDGSLGSIPTQDIESVTVLKDASAAAVYGSRSANGVILIQTKKGYNSNHKPNFNVNFSYGISNELKRMKTYDAPGYLKRILDIRSINGLEADPDKISIYLQAEESKNYGASPDHKPTITDPYDMFYQNAYELKGGFSVSNSSDLANYYISTSLIDQKGVVMNDSYKQFSGRINIDTHLTDWFNLGIKAGYTRDDYSGDPVDLDLASFYSPYASIYDDEGHYLNFPQTTTSFESPFWSMHTNDKDVRNLLTGIIDAKLTCPWVKGLSYEMIFSNELRWNKNGYFDNEYTTSGKGKHGKGQQGRTSNYHMMLDNMIKYNNTFNDKHNVDLTLLYSLERRRWDDVYAYGETFDNTVLAYYSLQDAKIQNATTGAGASTDIGLMARLTYTFDRRYSVTGTVRRDGCSAFSKNNKWANFGSFGFNWNITHEKFMKSVDWLDNLALRMSYGTNGNQSISPYSTLAKVSTSKYLYAGDTNYSIVQKVSSLPLDDLSWEKTTGYNVGVDFSVLNERLSGSIDAYFTTTKDLLFTLSLPTVSGFSSMLSNLGKIKNRGIEISLHSINIRNKDFSWVSYFAFSLNRNKVATIYGTDSDGDGKEDDLISSGYFIGKSLESIYDYNVIGIWQQSDADNGTIMEGMRPGDYKLEDLNEDGKISSDQDRKILGTRKENFRWSLTNTFTYKDLSLLVYINSVWGGHNYYLSGNNTPYYDGYVNYTGCNRTVYDYWMPNNPNAEYPRPDYSERARYKGTKYYDRSFIKLQKIALSYDLTRMVRRFGLNNLVLTFSADNLLTFAPHWKGLDPETEQGEKITARPSIRTYQFGLTFNF